MRPVRLGIIGCGVISESHLELAAKCPLAKVIAVADVMRDRAKARAEQFKIPAVYSSADELMQNPDIEAVVMALPTGIRTPLVFKALKLGKHVLIEKPVASKSAEVEKMIALRGNRVAACCSSRYTFTGHGEAAAKFVASGALGKVRVLRIRAIIPVGPRPSDAPPPWRESMRMNGGGILVNWSCYELNYLMHITGWKLRPESVMARWWKPAPAMKAYAARGSDADAHYAALILCNNDAALSMERAEFSSTHIDEAWEIIGTKGSLHMQMVPRKNKPNAVIFDRFVPGAGVVSKTIWRNDRENPDYDVITDFAKAIRQGRRPRTGLEQALILQQITDAVYKSAKAGRSVSVRGM